MSFSGAIKWNAAGVFAGGGQYTGWQMTGDSFGGGILIWEGIGAIDSDIYVQRVSRDGISLWGANGKLICNSLRDNRWPNLVADGTGGAVAVWQDEREGIDIVYVHAMRVPAGGGQFVTGVDANKSPQPRGSLYQNKPNPFNPTTAITYELQSEGTTTMIIYDVSGRVVRTLRAGWTPSGRHQVTWDGTDDNGRPQPSGVFYYRLVGPGIDEARKMVLLR
ncbi:MAG TPA: FlgD immunoglobulin-like domain containing protein [Candidatus Eisenbacteria bacterium]|nr:FlgD immunoglobulin-like domain containing protein [Candidatus Eisenbacteria bacterium]